MPEIFRLSGTVTPVDIAQLATLVETRVGDPLESPRVVDCAEVTEFAGEAVHALAAILKERRVAGTPIQLAHCSPPLLRQMKAALTEYLLIRDVIEPLQLSPESVLRLARIVAPHYQTAPLN